MIPSFFFLNQAIQLHIPQKVKLSYNQIFEKRCPVFFRLNSHRNSGIVVHRVYPVRETMCSLTFLDSHYCIFKCIMKAVINGRDTTNAQGINRVVENVNI